MTIKTIEEQEQFLHGLIVNTLRYKTLSSDEQYQLLKELLGYLDNDHYPVLPLVCIKIIRGLLHSPYNLNKRCFPEEIIAPQDKEMDQKGKLLPEILGEIPTESLMPYLPRWEKKEDQWSNSWKNLIQSIKQRQTEIEQQQVQRIKRYSI